MTRCPTCGSTDLREYVTTPPPLKGAPTVKVPGWLCWACRMFRPIREA